MRRILLERRMVESTYHALVGPDQHSVRLRGTVAGRAHSPCTALNQRSDRAGIADERSLCASNERRVAGHVLAHLLCARIDEAVVASKLRIRSLLGAVLNEDLLAGLHVRARYDSKHAVGPACQVMLCAASMVEHVDEGDEQLMAGRVDGVSHLPRNGVWMR